MLDNKDKRLIYDKYNEGDGEALEIEIKKKFEERIDELTVYLRNRKMNNILDKNDLMLFEHLNADIKAKIVEEVTI